MKKKKKEKKLNPILFAVTIKKNKNKKAWIVLKPEAFLTPTKKINKKRLKREKKKQNTYTKR